MFTNRKSESLRSSLVAVALLVGCGAKSSSQETAPADGTAMVALSLEKGSICPFPGGLQGFFWWIQLFGGGLVPVSATKADVEAYCSGARDYIKRVHLTPGDYELILHAKDGNGKVVNDVEASYDAISVAKGATTNMMKAYTAASSPRSFGDDPTGTTSVSVPSDSGDLVCGTNPVAASGCCCPAMCKGESYVGCGRAVRNGLCTGWTNPCGC